jgi:hypothetical protein
METGRLGLWTAGALASLTSLAPFVACGPKSTPENSELGGDAGGTPSGSGVPGVTDSGSVPLGPDGPSSVGSSTSESGAAPRTGADAASLSSAPDATPGSPSPSPTSADAGADGSSPSSATPEAGAGCPGVPIVPDDGGFVAPGSNSVAIHGSWFGYSDCTDLKGVNCATMTTPPANSFPNVGGKLCTSGQTSTAAGAWGAGIALELNDGPPQQPYDTVAHGVKGFCFVLSGATIPSTTIRVAFTTQNNNDNAYFAPVSTPGQHTVLFSDTAQGSWVTAKSAFEPTKVMLMQLQIPSSTTAPVPWDFCIEGVTAITQ